MTGDLEFRSCEVNGAQHESGPIIAEVIGTGMRLGTTSYEHTPKVVAGLSVAAYGPDQSELRGTHGSATTLARPLAAPTVADVSSRGLAGVEVPRLRWAVGTLHQTT